MIGVTFALPAESSRFLRRLRNKSRSDHDGVKIIRGEIDDHTIEVLHTGVGETVCRERTALFLHDRQLDYLISAGFAGALNQQLHVGDLFLAKNFSTVDVARTRSLLSNGQIEIADLLTISSMIDSAEEREKIARATGAAAADMETEFIARACAERALPLLSLRVISDTPAKAFPAPAHVLFDTAKQRTEVAKLAAFFLMHPNRIPRLIHFAKQIAGARQILTNALIDVISNSDP